jgi:hypothetical protein
MRSFFQLFLLTTLLTALPASAQTISAEIGKTGLAATEARLAALPTPTDADRFALGGIRFLRAVEGTLQLRWQTGLSEQMTMIPFLRLPIPENPNPTPFEPAAIATLFTNVSTGMDAARAPLSEIPAGSDFGVDISFADLWFDINANNARDQGEDMLDVMGPMIMGWQWDERDPATPAPVIRFDGADAAWLSAYTHLLGGLSDMILAYDPTTPITRINDARTAMSKLGMLTPDPIFGMGGGSSMDAVDYFAIILATLNQTPNKDRMASAQSHLLAMVTDNRRFWSEVVLETDNANEWLPNDAQKSSLGIELPPGTGPMWLGVLSDIEALVKGDKLVPYWRIEGPAGVNVGRMFTDPRPIDLAAWIQGEGAVPYLETGDLISMQNWSAFEQMMSGQAMLFTLFLN